MVNLYSLIKLTGICKVQYPDVAAQRADNVWTFPKFFLLRFGCSEVLLRNKLDTTNFLAGSAGNTNHGRHKPCRGHDGVPHPKNWAIGFDTN